MDGQEKTTCTNLLDCRPRFRHRYRTSMITPKQARELTDDDLVLAKPAETKIDNSLRGFDSDKVRVFLNDVPERVRRHLFRKYADAGWLVTSGECDDPREPSVDRWLCFEIPSPTRSGP